MKYVLIVTALLTFQVAEARGKRVKPEKTPEREIEACKLNPSGMTMMLRKSLNARRNPLADNVSGIDIAKFCSCFGPKGFEFQKGNEKGGQDKYHKFQKFFDTASVACAAASVPAKKPALKPFEFTGEKVNDARFNELTESCVERFKKNENLALTGLKIHLSAQLSPRVDLLSKLDHAKYCSCTISHQRGRLGDKVALDVLGSARPSGNHDYIKIGAASNEAFDECTIAQIPYPR